MNAAFLIFMVLHVLGAIIAFGPTFAFSITGGMGGKEPMHSNFALRVNERIEKGIVLPLAIVQLITGIGLIWFAPIDLAKAIWLDVSIVLFAIALAVAYLNQVPAMARLVAATRNPPPPPSTGAPARSGPPPAIAADLQRVQVGGMVMGALVVIITILMVLGSNGAFGANI